MTKQQQIDSEKCMPPNAAPASAGKDPIAALMAAASKEYLLRRLLDLTPDDRDRVLRALGL